MNWHHHVEAIVTWLNAECHSGESFLLNYHGENSDFIRFNHALVGQIGSVSKHTVSLDLIRDQSHAQGSCAISGRLSDDQTNLRSLLKTLRRYVAISEPDPFLLYNQSPESTEHEGAPSSVSTQVMLSDILSTAQGTDLVGILANGEILQAFANNLGQFNWHSQTGFNFDWSLHLHRDKASKGTYAGCRWSRQVLEAKLNKTKKELDILRRPAKTIEPGSYRAYIAPRALCEIVQLLGWGGFSSRAIKTHTSPLHLLSKGHRQLHRDVTFVEDHQAGMTPRFSDTGFMKSDRIELVTKGLFSGSLTDARSAMEYAIDANDASEHPESMTMAAGHLDEKETLSQLDTGILLNDLWYLNFSDLNEARITGMTRFACFWVEDGQIQCPLNVMRFDDSVYNLLGSSLLALTQQRELIADPSSYGFRSQTCAQLPGALLSSIRLTL